MDLTSPWIADYQDMFADDEDEEEDMVAGGLSEYEDDDTEVGVVARQLRQLSASASARAGADEEFMDLTSPDFSSVPAPSLSISVAAAKRPAPATAATAASAAPAASSPSAAQPPQRRKHQHHSKSYQARRLPDPLGCNRTKR